MSLDHAHVGLFGMSVFKTANRIFQAASWYSA